MRSGRGSLVKARVEPTRIRIGVVFLETLRRLSVLTTSPIGVAKRPRAGERVGEVGALGGRAARVGRRGRDSPGAMPLGGSSKAMPDHQRANTGGTPRKETETSRSVVGTNVILWEKGPELHNLKEELVAKDLQMANEASNDVERLRARGLVMQWEVRPMMRVRGTVFHIGLTIPPRVANTKEEAVCLSALLSGLTHQTREEMDRRKSFVKARVPQVVAAEWAEDRSASPTTL